MNLQIAMTNSQLDICKDLIYDKSNTVKINVKFNFLRTEQSLSATTK